MFVHFTFFFLKKKKENVILISFKDKWIDADMFFFFIELINLLL